MTRTRTLFATNNMGWRNLQLRSVRIMRMKEVQTMLYSFGIEGENPTKAQLDAFIRAGNMLTRAGKRGEPLSEKLFLRVCEVALGTRRYRRANTTLPTADWTAVPDLMVELLGGVKGVFYPEKFDGWANENFEPTYQFMAVFHIRLMYIHPLSDGNGRVGRVLFKYHAALAGLPEPVLRRSDRKQYKSAVANGDVARLAALLKRRAGK